MCKMCNSPTEWTAVAGDAKVMAQVTPNLDVLQHTEKNCMCGPSYSFQLWNGSLFGTVVHNAFDGRQ